MAFLYSFWWLLFVLPLVPLIIHLINMLRHQRVEWAAMEFLLKSYKKHSQWVWLMQILLLLMRMGAVALIVAMLAQLTTTHLPFLQQRVTHHYVLLDDSYSMSDKAAGQTAFDLAKQAIAHVGGRAKLQDSPQRFTLVRFSRAIDDPSATPAPLAASPAPADADKAEGATTDEGKSPAAENQPAATDSGLAGLEVGEGIADLNAAIVDVRFDETLEGLRARLDPSQLAAGPLAGLRTVQQLISAAGDENRVVYVVSDFRTRDWESPADLREALQRLREQQAEIQFISCVDQVHPNLTLVHLAPEERTRAAGVPLFVDFAVKNNGRETARDVKVSLTSTFYPTVPKGTDLSTVKGRDEELPPVVIRQIAPGETARGRAQVYFPEAGQHVVQASLPEDAVSADNHRWTVVDFPPGNPVMIVDGDLQRNNEYYLASAFVPGGGEGRVRTGIAPEMKTIADLRDATLESLRNYYAIYLLNVPRLDPQAIEKLEAYVQNGGGVAFFVGPDVNLDHYNEQLHRKGQGLFPVAIAPHQSLAPPGSPDVPDFQVANHPMFKVLFGDRNANVRRIGISEYYPPQQGWKADPDSVQILATLHNGHPLVVEKQLGEGRVVAFLTSLSPGVPAWNNWVGDPLFVVTALELQSHLASGRRAEPPRLVGRSLEISVPADKYQSQVSFLVPSARSTTTRTRIEREAVAPRDDSPLLQVSLAGVGGRSPTGPETAASGVYETWLLRNDNTPEPRRVALNVLPDEGDLTTITAEQLKSKLPGIDFEYRLAADLNLAGGAALGSSWTEILLLVLILLLLAEQFVAYVASYHPTPAATPPA